MPNQDRTEQFVEQFSDCQVRLHAYIRTLVYDPDTARDILQQTSLVLWRKFDQFTPGTDFMAWACSIAFHEVRAWQRDAGRDRLVFNESLLERLSTSAECRVGALHGLTRRLRRCVQKLSSAQRNLLYRRYADGVTVKAIADEQKRTPNAVSCSLYHIRQTLLKCMEATPTEEEPA